MGRVNTVQGRNSCLINSPPQGIFYEKLSNTVHVGEPGELEGLQERVELVDYSPSFETETLRRKREDPLSMILLEVTEQCNFSCSYCIYSEDYPFERTPSTERMSFDTARRAIEGLVPFSGRNILVGFYGGSHFLRWI
tara:strand:+ start:168 stop:581 length:414 start_codon:yes stop_codon:yes gene_type:complete